ncbi:ras GTPase-activating protein-binding protein 2 [Morus notabilis]|uniref:ras GTPase-activating protein-binding protein 2 n=1 Tax=Morus notabilis TaxID=981085 RepID=UPI000CED1707|nr:ras GTPase-activating protein-binding protein 2 [Morus notabilis]
MANQSEDPAIPTAQIVGNAFIQQYYLTLHKSPDMVHKFYTDDSVLSRPGPDGVMTSVTTMQGISEMILSLDYQNYHAQILSADAQFSYKDGVIVLVTGCLTGNNNEKRKFTQSFFLAPQDKVAKSYFVLNDVFRYIDDVANNDADGSSQTPLTPVVESTNAADQPVLSETTSVEIEVEVEVATGNDESQVIPPVDHEKERITEKVVVAAENGHVDPAENSVDLSQSAAHSVSETTTSTLQEDAPKKSFASVVNALNKNSAPFHVRAPQPKPAKLVEQPRAPVVPVPPAPAANGAPEKNNDPAVKAYAIFVANLPMIATVEELDKLFKQFGPIKHDGIQVRSNKQQGTCFGFVEFESASSMQSALEASPIVFGNRKLSIEERRANNDRAKLSSGRSGYRNDNFRGSRGNYSGNRGYGRNEFEKRGEFSGRARGNGNGGRNGEAHQRPIQNWGERVAQQEAKVA